ncbi:MAG: hypothetical protein U0744_02570 [Gemmataceae bacterium]
MHPLQMTKEINISPPKAIVDNASWTTNVIDCQGFDYLKVTVSLGALDIAMAALKLQESDTATDGTTLSSPSDTPGMVFGTSNNTGGSASTLPSATADNNLYSFELDLRGRKRYQQLVATGGDGAAGTFMSATAQLYGGKSTPVSPTERGVAQILRA